MEKKEYTKIVIHDVSSGNWEINEVIYPLVREYRPGLTTILPLKGLSTIKDADTYGVYLTAPKWYDYMLFGVRMMYVQAVNRIHFIINSLHGRIPFKEFYGKTKTGHAVRKPRTKVSG